MSKKDDRIQTLLNEFQEKQNKFQEEQIKFSEEQRRINKKLDKQNKNSKRIILFMIAFCLILSGVTGVASYSFGASSVSYTAKDTTWEVENTEEAIDDLYSSVGSALVGSIYSYMGNNAPFGYLACDGTEYNIADYPRLAAHFNKEFGSINYFGGDGETTFAVPDLRGEFLRGTGTNSHTNTAGGMPEGSGAAVGVHQEATLERGITINAKGAGYVRASTIHIDRSGNNTSEKPDAEASTGSWENSLGNNWVEAGGIAKDYTARPTNTSVLYIIKY